MVAKVTAAAIALRWEYGAATAATDVFMYVTLMAVTVAIWEVAERVLVVFLLMVKNGGGWPDQ